MVGVAELYCRVIQAVVILEDYFGTTVENGSRASEAMVRGSGASDLENDSGRGKKIQDTLNIKSRLIFVESQPPLLPLFLNVKTICNPYVSVNLGQ